MLLGKNTTNGAKPVAMRKKTMSGSRATVTGQCDHCEWEALATSYTEMVRMYQDHLRVNHPKAWMRS